MIDSASSEHPGDEHRRTDPAYRPPPGGSAWADDPRRSPLLYLAWGLRRYGDTPLPLRRRFDWIYVAPRSGEPTVVINGVRRRLPAGRCLILAPGCETEYRDHPGRACRIQTWVWRDAPAFPALRPTPGKARILRLSSAQTREARAVHDACRREVRDPDAHTAFSLETLRRRLDLCLVRGQGGGAAADQDGAQRLELALHWLREHPENHAPAAGLADYLQLSPATLRRLFRRHLGHGPREAARRIRMREARRLIDEEGQRVKEAAHRLGYAHPNDLSRALAAAPDRETEL